MQLVLQLGINEYADLTWEEFRESKLGLKAGHDGSFRCTKPPCASAVLRNCAVTDAQVNMGCLHFTSLTLPALYLADLACTLPR